MAKEMHRLAFQTRVFIKEAHCTKWRNWKFWLLNFAGKTRREYLDEIRQKNHFRDEVKMVADEHGQWSLF